MRTASSILVAGVVTLMFGTSVRADLMVAKTISFTWNPKNAAVPGLGSATWGKNAARDTKAGMQSTQGPSSAAFNLSTVAASLAPTKMATATAGAASSEVEIGVGQVTALPNGNITVPGTINITLKVPATGGNASGVGKINLNGATTVTGLTVNGNAVAAPMIGKTLAEL